AIEKVVVHNNTSYMNSEQLAARLSVIPLRCDPYTLDELNYQPMRLYMESHNERVSVKASDIEITDQRITLPNPNLPLVTLAPEQCINVTMYYEKGNAHIHSKFSPTSIVEMIPKGDTIALNIESVDFDISTVLFCDGIIYRLIELEYIVFIATNVAHQTVIFIMAQGTIFFFKTDEGYGHFSQWAKSTFTDESKNKFSTAEQYFMYHKARYFNDIETAEIILRSVNAHPGFHRKKGREIKEFNAAQWSEVCEDIAYRGNMLKFTQNEKLKALLLETDNMMLVEASPYDRIWGIGYSMDDASHNTSSWGKNLLGRTLMKVRDEIRLQPSCVNHTTGSNMSGHIAWKKDVDWEKPMVQTKGRERFDDIDKWLYRPGLVCRIYGGEYIFIDTSNYWTNLASSEAMSRVNSLVGILNATVNYEKSIRAFLKYIVKRCNSRVGKSIPTSVCIGTKRLELDLDRETRSIRFYDSRPLLDDISHNIHAGVAGVCIMPIDTIAIPEAYTFPGKGDIVNYLQKLFPDMRDFMTIIWHIGNCLVDPIARPKSVMLCGPGGSGKRYTKSMHPDVAEVIASNRMAICYDVDLEKDQLNMGVFKNISGSDYIRVGHISYLDKQPQYHTDAIMRRVVCVLMNVAALSIPATVVPEDPESRMDFACFCIYMDEACMYIEETFDFITVFDGLGVISVLSKLLEMTSEEIIFKSKLISSMSVIDIDGTTAIRGLRLR
ncbi:hypothetical protein LOZ61_006776, partial [Ophidiomyces ophidiicola]